jgi:hypothetical protein
MSLWWRHNGSVPPSPSTPTQGGAAMLTPLPITNEAVARGYVHRTLREASER